MCEQMIFLCVDSLVLGSFLLWVKWTLRTLFIKSAIGINSQQVKASKSTDTNHIDFLLNVKI